eukprot:scaffold113434_cov60-Phaeocystis_antarctica.AAC.3
MPAATPLLCGRLRRGPAADPPRRARTTPTARAAAGLPRPRAPAAGDGCRGREGWRSDPPQCSLAAAARLRSLAPTAASPSVGTREEVRAAESPAVAAAAARWRCVTSLTRGASRPSSCACAPRQRRRYRWRERRGWRGGSRRVQLDRCELRCAEARRTRPAARRHQLRCNQCLGRCTAYARTGRGVR